MDYVSSLLSTMYGNSLALGNASVVGSPSTDVLARVEQALAPQRGAAAKLNASFTASQARFSGLGQLQSALAVFQDVAESLAGSGLSTSASSSAKNVLGAVSGPKAEVGTHDIRVSQLAQQQILISPEADSANTPLGTGSPTVIRIGSGNTSKSITIDSRNNSLQGIADALKDAGFDASLVRSSTGTALQLRSASGEASKLNITVAGDATIRSLVGGLEQTQAAQDAILTVDGKSIRSAGNKLESAIQGVTLNLAATGNTTVTVARDSSQIAKNVDAFVKGFNALQDRFDSLGKGALKGNTALNQVRSQLDQLVRSAGGSSEALASAGLSVDSNGRLKLDSEKLNAAISADPAAVTKLFTNEGRGLADSLGSRLDSLAGQRSVVASALKQADREVEGLQSRRSSMAQMLTVQAQALVRLYTQDAQLGGPTSLLDLLA
ncbi:flagellar filament capping protein FliD [Pseudoduganella violaceinigra]|uniref:flagellar filament capping protein FliD n=1 Tax=Pseudoduganella violaceinigra TaxID=246602 RepID=UPI0004093683|nr:flagellar filament capping protein FliD [Pseudoduganella violaceinigra]